MNDFHINELIGMVLSYRDDCLEIVAEQLMAHWDILLEKRKATLVRDVESVIRYNWEKKA